MIDTSTVAVIPARYASTRLPGKPLLDIAGKPMIVRVCERAAAASSIARVVVATDDERIAFAVRETGFEAEMTAADHPSGTDRVAEVADRCRAGIVVNVQGDEPLIDPRTIDAAVAALLADPELAIATACEPLELPGGLLDPNTVKVVVDRRGRALYFSRAPIPFPRDAGGPAGLDGGTSLAAETAAVARKHTGLYAYRREALLALARLEPTPLERLERLEQLRALEHGYPIGVVEAVGPSIGVDDEAGLARARALWDDLIKREGAATLP